MSDAERELRERAERRVEARRGLWSHALVYVCVNAGLFFIDWFTGGGIDWAWWPLAGWGIGLFAHAVSVWFSLSGNHESAVQREMERLRGK